MEWSLFDGDKKLEPLVFSNGKSQKDVVEEVLTAIKSGHKVVLIKGMCGTGKSAIALNIAKELGRASIVVPIKSLQEQYAKDYSDKKYVEKNGKKLKIKSVFGRQNFKCKYLQESDKPTMNLADYYSKEKNAKLSDIFSGVKPKPKASLDKSCNNFYLPCKIEIKEKNLPTIKDYIKQNPKLKISDFDSINDVRRMSIAPVCDYWSPILPSEFEIRQFNDANKIKYMGLDDREFTIYQRKPGCGFYDQYLAYANADVIIFNSAKYKLETVMGRKPRTDVEIIDECDNFLDSFANREQINLSRLLFGLNLLFPEDTDSIKIIEELVDITNTLKIKKEYTEHANEIFRIKETLVGKLLSTVMSNTDFLEKVECDENNYVYHLDEVAKTFHNFMDETFFSFEKRDRDIIIHLVTTNLAKKFQELLDVNKVLVLMSGTLHSEAVLKNIFGLQDFKVVDAEVNHQGDLIKCKCGYEKDCKYSNFKNQLVTREDFLKALSKTISAAKRPTLVHITAFADLPTDYEKQKYALDNLPTQYSLINFQSNDPLGQRVKDFADKKTNLLFTTRCNRGVDFPGDVCNSIVITRFPYPNISSIFWKILRQTHPMHFRNFYMDKARRDLLQKIYRGLRSKNDKVYLLSPDSRVLDFEIE
ncbi:DEAD/DEAH box helicase family protein [Candidatus Pacearchaeota archaeon]|nr:DEAD/DEAH box helicase family protein [Candidatus Pacearchaeota archaeon]